MADRLPTEPATAPAAAPTPVVAAAAPGQVRSPSPPPPTLTKRRLESAITALDNATNHNTKSNTRSPSTPSFPYQPKRLRLSTPTSLPSLEALLPPTSLGPASPPPPPPSYTPLSLPHLLTRLSTFKLSTFSPLKPPSLSPLACALHGWHSSPTPQKPKDRVQCVTCRAGLVLALPGGGWSTPLGVRLAGEMERLVVAGGHNAGCPWRTRACARGLYALKAGVGRGALVEELREEVGRLDREGVGRMVLKLPGGVGAEERVKVGAAVREGGEVASAEEAPAPAEAKAEPTDSIDPTVAPFLALFGWHSPTPAILTCTFCTRQVPLTAYLPKPSPSTSSEPPPPSPPPPPAFDVVSQHQAFCPYISSPSLSASTSKSAVPAGLGGAVLRAGWEVRLDTLLRRERQGTRGGQGVATMLGATAGGTPNGKQGVSRVAARLSVASMFWLTLCMLG